MEECSKCEHRDDFKEGVTNNTYASFYIRIGNMVIATRSPECEHCEIMKKWIESIEDEKKR